MHVHLLPGHDSAAVNGELLLPPVESATTATPSSGNWRSNQPGPPASQPHFPSPTGYLAIVLRPCPSTPTPIRALLSPENEDRFASHQLPEGTLRKRNPRSQMQQQQQHAGQGLCSEWNAASRASSHDDPDSSRLLVTAVSLFTSEGRERSPRARRLLETLPSPPIPTGPRRAFPRKRAPRRAVGLTPVQVRRRV